MFFVGKDLSRPQEPIESKSRPKYPNFPPTMGRAVSALRIFVSFLPIFFVEISTLVFVIDACIK